MHTSAFALILGIVSVQASEPTAIPAAPEAPGASIKSLPPELKGEVNKNLTGKADTKQPPAEKALLMKKQFEKEKIFPKDGGDQFEAYMKLAAEWHVDKVGPVTLQFTAVPLSDSKIIPHLAKVNTLNLSIVINSVTAESLRTFMNAAKSVNPQITVKVDAHIKLIVNSTQQGFRISAISDADQQALTQEFKGQMTFGEVATS